MKAHGLPSLAENIGREFANGIEGGSTSVMRLPQREENSPFCNRLVLAGPLMRYQDGSEPQGLHMARKPKASKSNEFAVSPEEVLAVLNDAPAPVRRGRKPKAAASPEPLAMMDSDDAAGGTAPAAAPMRKRPGPKPKQRASAAKAAPSQDNTGAKPRRRALAPEPTPDPMPPTAGKPHAGPSGQQDPKNQVQGSKPVPQEATKGATASGAAWSGSSRNAAASTQPAAYWDRAADTVRFDWAEIERTASQDGPNQVMAKLMVAARAEGANSRWPF